MVRRPLIAGNWKMYKTEQEARKFAVDLLGQVSEVTDVDILICAPFTALHGLKEELGESAVQLGAQNMHWENQGAFTGEVSSQMLLEAACTYVILGHSERRELFKEEDEFIAKKVKAALGSGLNPVLCVGEKLSAREDGSAFAVVNGQLTKDLEGLGPDILKKVVIAYEPIWAIGTGRTASAHDAQEMCAAIRRTLENIAGPVAGEIRILYGGSVKAGNIAELLSRPDIDGALVGGASLEVREFGQLIQNAR